MRSHERVRSAQGGCYDASRAAALSGVPKSTVYWWARHGIVVPSVSPVQEKLWSYSDLMCLRIVSWLRRPKQGHPDNHELPASPMPQVRKALQSLSDLGLDLWSSDQMSPLLVDVRGRIWLRHGESITGPEGQTALPDLETFGLTDPYDGGLRGPDLVKPRPHFRIIPGKLAGEPHVADTRLTSAALASLHFEGFNVSRIAELYEVDVSVVEEAVDLERQLQGIQTAA